MQETQEAHNHNAKTSLKDINNELKLINLPTNWIQINEEPIVLCQVVFMDGAAEVRITIIICTDLSWKCYYYDKEIKESSCVITSLPSHMNNSNVILECIAKLKQTQTCIGNHDNSFISMSVERQGKFVDLEGSITAVADDKDVLYNGQAISRTIRHINCDIFISSKETLSIDAKNVKNTELC